MSGIRLVQAGAQCEHCEKTFHQIDGTEERALAIVRDALERHVATEHAEPTT